MAEAKNTNYLSSTETTKTADSSKSNIFCNLCSHIIVIDQLWIACSACALRYHIDCACVTNMEYECLQLNPFLSWSCLQCNEKKKMAISSYYDTTNIITETKSFKDIGVNVASIRNELEKYNTFHTELMDLKRSIRELVGKQSFEFKRTTAILAEVREITVRIGNRESDMGTASFGNVVHEVCQCSQLSKLIDTEGSLSSGESEDEISEISEISEPDRISSLNRETHSNNFELSYTNNSIKDVESDSCTSHNTQQQKSGIIMGQSVGSESRINTEQRKLEEADEKKGLLADDEMNSKVSNNTQDHESDMIDETQSVANCGINENGNTAALLDENNLEAKVDTEESISDIRENESEEDASNMRKNNASVESTSSTKTDREILIEDKGLLETKIQTDINVNAEKLVKKEAEWNREERSHDIQKGRAEVKRSRLSFDMQVAEQERINRRKQAEKRLFQTEKRVFQAEKRVFQDEQRVFQDDQRVFQDTPEPSNGGSDDEGILEIKPIIEKFEASSRKSKLMKERLGTNYR